MESLEFRGKKGEESVNHFLFSCPRRGELREEMRRLAGRRWGGTSYILGGWSGLHKDEDFKKKWHPAKEMIIATINFAIATGRLEDRKSREDNLDEDSDEERGRSEGKEKRR